MTTQKTREEIHPAVIREWLHDDHIVAYTLGDVAREAIDAWAEAVIDLQRQWPDDRSYLALYDVSSIPALTPYARKRAEDIASNAAQMEIEGRYAVVLKRSIISMIIRLFMQRDLTERNRHFERRLFFNGMRPLPGWPNSSRTRPLRKTRQRQWPVKSQPVLKSLKK